MQISTMEFSEKMSSNANLNTLTIYLSLTFVKSSIWDAWLGGECALVYNTSLKIQAKILLWKQVKMESFWSLGQLIV